jgi:error-prone DNA polymerase
MRLVDGLRESEARLIEHAVTTHGPFTSITALWRATGVKVPTLRRLAHADAFRSMGLDRQHALWEVRSLKDEVLPLFDELADFSPSSLRRWGGVAPSLPVISPSRHVIHDYESTGLSLRAHPVSFIRDHLDRRHITRNIALKDQQAFPHGARVAVAGVVLVRQRPSTASGVVFMTIEDETGVANLIVWPQIYKKFRKAARHSVVITVRGRVQRDGEVVHVLVSSIVDTTDDVAGLDAMSRDFR